MSDLVAAPVAEQESKALVWHAWQVLAMALILLVTAGLTIWSAATDALVTRRDGHLPAWLFLALILLAAAFTLLAGWALTGLWSGSLIDPTKGRMSLSRLQAMLWTIFVIPAFLTAAMINLSQQNANSTYNKGKLPKQQIVIKDPLDITIPGELLAVMGLSLGSAFVSRLVLVKKADEKKTTDDAKATGEARKSVYVAQAPEWRDLFRGDTVESRNLLDLGKLQLFLITAAILIAYGTVVANAFVSRNPHGISALPALSGTIVGLLAISHAGYLTNKAAQ
jgi:hypothetical protein